MMPDRMRRSVVVAWLAALGSVADGIEARAQGGPVTIGGGPECPACRVVLEHVVTLGHVDDPIGIRPSASVVRNDAGVYFVAPTFSRGQISVFDANGAFLTTIGRFGGGPKEFRRIYTMTVGPGDTLHVFSTGRHSVVEPVSHEIVRTHRLVGRARNAFIDRAFPQQIVVGGDLRTTGGVGHPVHLVEGDRVVRSFGAPDGTYRPGGLMSAAPIARARHREIWVVPLTEYSGARWRRDGTRTDAFERPVDWFRSPVRSFDRLASLLDPTISDIREDDQGRLWVLARIANEAGVRWLRRQPREGEGRVPSTAEVHEIYTTVVEVIDPKRNTVVASLRVEPVLYGFVADDLVYAIRAEPSGNLVIDVWTIALAGSP